MAKKWVFTAKRKVSLRKAQRQHVLLVEAGKRALHRNGKHKRDRD